MSSASASSSQPGPAAELLRQLVSIPSVNPYGQSDASICGEARIADFVADYLRDLGAAVELEPVLPDRPNVIARFPTDRPGKQKLLLAPHLDTVGIDGMTVDPFAARIVEGRLYGRGACDTKGTMAAMLQALTELGDDIASLPMEIHFGAMMAEETAQIGSRHFAEHHGADYAFAVVGEPTEGRVVHTHKGSSWCQVVFRGQAAHGSTPEAGHNAIADLARAVTWLDGPFRRHLAEIVPADPQLGTSTINIGTCHGGSRTNIVPDRAEVSLDLRSIPALDDIGGPINLLKRQLTEAGIPGTIEPGANEGTALATDPDHPLVRQLAAIGEGLTGAPWFCDAANLAAAGVPSVACGPGSIRQAHTPDEWLSLEELEKGTAIYRRFLESACST